MLGRRLANPECLLIAQRCPLVRSGRSAGPPSALPKAKLRVFRLFQGWGTPCPPNASLCRLPCQSMRSRGVGAYRVRAERTSATARGAAGADRLILEIVAPLLRPASVGAEPCQGDLGALRDEA